MKALSYDNLLLVVSKQTKQAYLSISVDPEFVDGNNNQVERALHMLPPEVMDILLSECSTTVVFDTPEEAAKVYSAINDALPTMIQVGLVAFLTYDGLRFLELSQIEGIFPEQIQTSTLRM